MNIRLPLLAAAILCASGLSADCIPKRILKIVTEAEVKDAKPGVVATGPSTVYRLGDRYGRIESEFRGEHHVRMLFIVNEPDVWIANLVNMTGQHMVDPGPDFEYHAQVFGDPESKLWSQLEFGCEEPFMKAAGARVEEAGPNAVLYTHTAEGTTVTLLVAGGKPSRLTIESPKQTYALRYLTFEMLDDDSTALFQRPENVRFTEIQH